jgi:predicted ATPase
MASPQPQPFAALLWHYRLAAGLTQEELAARARLSVGAIGALERGLRRSPRRDTLALLSDALGLAAPDRARLEAAARQDRGALAARPGLVAAPSPAPSAPPLVGRARALIRLGHHLSGGGPPLLLLTGEPGIGKTRLLHEAAARARDAGWTVLAGGCTRRSGQEPYAPLLGALARCLATRPPALLRTDLDGCAWLARLLPELAERAVVPAPAWELPPEQERRLMFDAVERVLANLAGPAGTLLVLDDLQWAGPEALDLLAALAYAAPNCPLRLLGAFQQTEPGAAQALGTMLADLAREGWVDDLALDPLTPAEASELLRHLLGGNADGPAGAAATERMVRRADGVPYFLVCFAQTLLAGTPAGAAAAAVPWGVRVSIRQRIVALGAPGQEMLRLAAVAGVRIPRRLLLAVAACGPARGGTIAAMEEAQETGLLLEDGPDGYRFAHDLVREVVAGDLSAARRAELEQRIARALERGPNLDLIEHYDLSRTRRRLRAPRMLVPVPPAARDNMSPRTAAKVRTLLP